MSDDAPEPATKPTPIDELTAAINAYKRALKGVGADEERAELEEICATVAPQLAPDEWAPAGELTLMASVNRGDGSAFDRAKEADSSSIWMSVRLTVAFEDRGERSMRMAYVFVGRNKAGDERIDLLTSEGEWRPIQVNSRGNQTTVSIMVEVGKREFVSMQRLLAAALKERAGRIRWE